MKTWILSLALLASGSAVASVDFPAPMYPNPTQPYPVYQQPYQPYPQPGYPAPQQPTYPTNNAYGPQPGQGPVVMRPVQAPFQGPFYFAEYLALNRFYGARIAYVILVARGEGSVTLADGNSPMSPVRGVDPQVRDYFFAINADRSNVHPAVASWNFHVTGNVFIQSVGVQLIPPGSYGPPPGYGQQGGYYGQQPNGGYGQQGGYSQPNGGYSGGFNGGYGQQNGGFPDVTNGYQPSTPEIIPFGP